MIIRCGWTTQDPQYISYHDREWGVPIHNDQELFEFLVLEGAQAGLSWITILKKRENYRVAFDHFDIEKVANYDQNKIEQLLQNNGIVRNKRKIEAAILNANAVLKIQQDFGSFDQYIWQFTNGETIVNHWKSQREVPTHSNESDAMSKALKKRGFKFVGSTICYSFMQATGMVNDHIIECFRHEEILHQYNF